MLYKNHKKVELTKEPIYIEKQKEFEAFIKGKKNILFKTHDEIKFNKGTGAKEPDRTQTIAAEAVVSNEFGSDDSWIYLEKAPKVLQNGENDYDRVKVPIFVTRVLNVPTTKKDLIFFLMYLSTAGRNGRIFAFNEEAEDEKKLIELSRSSNVDFFLTSSYSPLTEANMRRIAKAFGIEKVDAMSKAKVIITLKAEVDKAEREGDELKNVAAFIKLMEEEDVTAIKAVVRESLDSGRITYDELEGGFYFTDESGAKIRKIITIDMLIRNNKMKREIALYNVFLTNEQKKKELYVLMGYSTIEVDWSKYQYSSLKKFAATQCGLDGTGKLEELVERISTYYDENKEKVKFDLSCLAVSEKKEKAE